MLFGQRGGLQAPEGKERGAARSDRQDVNARELRATTSRFFHLPCPCSPVREQSPPSFCSLRRLTAILRRIAAIGAAIAAVFLVSFVVLYMGARLIGMVGEGGVHIATRVMGIVLAALAVQYVLNGVTGYYQLLRGR